MTRRLVAELTTEALLLKRYRVLFAIVAVTFFWSILLRALPPPLALVLVPWILFLDLAALAFFFVPVLHLVEHSSAVTEALLVTRVSPGELTTVRTGAITLLALVASGVVLVVARASAAQALVGVLLMSILMSLLGLAISRGVDTFTAFMTRVPVVAVPLLVPAMAYLLGLSRSPLLHASPLTSGVSFLVGDGSVLATAWMLVWIAALGRLVSRPLPMKSTRVPRARFSSWPVNVPFTRLGAIRSLAKADRTFLLHDALSLMLLGAVPLIAAVVRVLSTSGLDWMTSITGVDVTEHLPFVWAFVLVIHTPVMFGTVTGMMFLEDADAHVLPAIAVTRSSLRGLLIYRLSAVSGMTLVAVLLALAIAGARHHAGTIGCILTGVAAAPLAPLTALLLTAFASNRAEGIALTKMITFPLYLPVLAWFTDAPAAGVLNGIPSAWAVRALWERTAHAAAVDTLVAVVFSAGIGYILVRRFEKRPIPS